MKKTDSQKLFEKARELEKNLNSLTREELRELVTIEMELADRGFDLGEDIDRHEKMWMNS